MTCRFVAVPLIALSLAACAERRGEFPSLAVRLAERDAAAAPVLPDPATSSPERGGAAAAAQVPAAVTGRIAAAGVAATGAHAAFVAALPAAQAAAGRAGPHGSESWVVAEQRLSELESIGAPVGDALADLDALAREQAPLGDASAQASLAAVTAAIATLEPLAAQQAAALAALHARLPDG